MRKILFLLSDLRYRGTTQQVRLLADGLRGRGFQTAVCALGTSGPLADPIRAAGVHCIHLDWQRWFDGSACWQLRQLLREYQPDILHAWGLPCLRAGRFAVSPRRERSHHFVASAIPAVLTRFDRWLLRGATMTQVTPGIALPDAPAAACPEGLPASARYLACVGPIEPRKGFREAVWALDILRYLYRDLRLVLVGEGSDIPRLKQFADSIRVGEWVHFLGPCADVAAVLRAALVVCVPTLTTGGTLVALEAMAASRPVVASRVPALADIIVEGETGLLVPPGNPVALARQTRVLLDAEPLRRRLGAAGRQRVQQSFTVEHLVRRFAELYNALAERSTHPGTVQTSEVLETSGVG